MTREPLTRLLDPPLAVARLVAGDGAALVDQVAGRSRSGVDGVHAGLAAAAGGIPVVAARMWLRRGVRRRPLAELPPAEAATIAVPLDELLTLEPVPALVLDVVDPAAVPPAIVAVAATRGAPGALWLCSSDHAALVEWRQLSPTVRLVRNCRLERLRDGPERLAADLAAHGLDGAKMSATDWSGGLTTLFHRFDRYCLSEHAEQPRELDEQVRRGLDVVSSSRVDHLIAAMAPTRR